MYINEILTYSLPYVPVHSETIYNYFIIWLFIKLLTPWSLTFLNTGCLLYLSKLRSLHHIIFHFEDFCIFLKAELQTERGNTETDLACAGSLSRQSWSILWVSHVGSKSLNSWTIFCYFSCSISEKSIGIEVTST